MLTYSDIPDSLQRVFLVLIGNRNDVIADTHRMPITPFQLFCLLGMVLQVLNTVNPIYTVVRYRLRHGQSISTPLFNLLPYYIWILSAFIAAHFSYSLLPVFPLIYVSTHHPYPHIHSIMYIYIYPSLSHPL